MWERNSDWLLFIGAPTGDRTHNLGMCSDLELNQRLFGLQSSVQPTEPHQPELGRFLFNCFLPYQQVLSYGQFRDFLGSPVSRSVSSSR